MDNTLRQASAGTSAATFDTLARSLRGPLSRRRVAALLAAAIASSAFGIGSRRAEAMPAGASSIPPNCIYVCCDGTCDSWKMCLRCVKWPKPTTSAAIAAQ